MNEAGEATDEPFTFSSHDQPMLGGWGLSVVCGCGVVSAAMMLAVGEANSHIVSTLLAFQMFMHAQQTPLSSSRLSPA